MAKHEPIHNLGHHAHPKKEKIGPNTTAPAGLERVGPNGSFPIGDPEHDRLAKAGAETSEAAGHITPAEAAHITAAADADEKRHAAPRRSRMSAAYEASRRAYNAKRGKQ